MDRHDFLALLGAAAAFTGLWWVYPPASLILAGAGVMIWAWRNAPAQQSNEGEG